MEIHFDQLVIEKSVNNHHVEILFQGTVVDDSFVVLFDVLDNEGHDKLDIWTSLHHI